MSTKIITTTLLFIREEGLKGVTTSALLKVQHVKKMSPDKILETLKKALTDWVKNARKGREAWQESCGDFNIGDLALNDRTAEKWCHETGTLKKYGLLGFSVTSCNDSDPIPFDTILIDRNSLPEDWDKE